MFYNFSSLRPNSFIAASVSKTVLYYFPGLFPFTVCMVASVSRNVFNISVQCESTCLHGGQCVKDGVIATCQCAHGYRGPACEVCKKTEPEHDKTKQNDLRPAKTQITLGIRPN